MNKSGDLPVGPRVPGPGVAERPQRRLAAPWDLQLSEHRCRTPRIGIWTTRTGGH